MKAYKLEYVYGKDGTPPEWYGTIAPYLTFMASFNSRLNEVRVGCAKFPLGKDGDVVKEGSVAQYGLHAGHHIHLDGITYPPHRRASLAQSVGPLTQLIMLCRSKATPQYSDRWKRAATKSLAHLPRSGELIERLLTCSHSEAVEILPLIANILTITGARSNCKAFFPFSLYVPLISSPLQISLSREPSEPMEEGADPTHDPVTIPEIELVDHSGKGAQTLYKKAGEVEFKMPFYGKPEDLGQVVFHAVWGTHWEDLELLRNLTDVNFFSRKELGNIFQGKGSAGAPMVSFKLIPLRYYSKLSQALPTEFTAGGQQQCWIKPRHLCNQWEGQGGSWS